MNCTSSFAGPSAVIRAARSAAPALIVSASLLLLGGCAQRVDVAEVLELRDVTTGWYDAGIVEDGKNKLVPSISLRLHNASDREVSSLQVNAVFRRVGEEEEWGSAFVRAVGQQGLAPGRDSQPIVLRSGLGYTGTEPRSVMLQHREFIDAQVEVFAKHRAQQWVRLGSFKVERQLLTR
jgi:hypothetical protein